MIRRGNFDKPRFLRYGFLKAHENHSDKKGHSTLICFDKQEKKFVRLKHDFVSWNGSSYIVGLVLLYPFVAPFLKWTEEFQFKFHWWFWVIAVVIGMVNYEFERRNDAKTFEDVKVTDEIIDSNTNYILLFMCLLLFDAFIAWLVLSDYPNFDFGDMVISFAMTFFTVGYVCLVIEGLYVHLRYVTWPNVKKSIKNNKK